MNKALWPALAVAVVAVAAFLAWYYVPRDSRRTPDDLKQQALSAATPQEQQAAAAQLCDWGPKAAAHMREVLATSQSPEVRSLMVQALGSQFDYDSMNQLLAALDDESIEVRQHSARAVRTMLGGAVPFDPAAPTADRAQAIASMRKDWEQLQASPRLNDFKERLRRGVVAPPGN